MRISVNAQRLGPVIGDRAARGQHDSTESTRKVLMIVEIRSHLQADKSYCSNCKQRGTNSLPPFTNSNISWSLLRRDVFCEIYYLWRFIIIILIHI